MIKKGSSIRIEENFIIQKENELTEGFEWIMNAAMKNEISISEVYIKAFYIFIFY